ncbi:helix-turn-helix domain-containing protein [Latilactobacillus sakei]|uniref:helix-turn-helix domain-containing protein n=1 Tax=Latilactobacillus sakei TaxID=1599 RepID=UPI00345DA3EE
MSKLSERLTHLRESKGWSKTLVVKKLGLKNLGTYANYEYGTREPDMDTIVKLAQLYDVTTDYLLGKSNNKNTMFPPESDDILTMYKIDTRGLTEDEISDMREELEEYNDFMTKRLQEKIAKKKRK